MKRNIIFALTFYIAILCIPQYAAAQSYSAPAGDIYREEGVASWYGPEFDGRPTASGETFNSALFTAAHPSLPFGTFLVITNRNNNRQVTVKVNDRGPFVASRCIDVSKAAAEHLDMIYTGIAPVIIETLPSTYFQSPSGTPTPVANYSDPQPVEAVPEPEPVAEPPTQAPGAPFPYPPITVNVYPSAQSPAQAQPEPQYPPQPQYQAQPQYPPQYQYQPPQSAYPFPAPVLPTMQVPPYQESYMPPPVQPALESPAPAVRLIPAINPQPGTTYRLQVGSYKAPRNAVEAFEKLKSVGLNPAYEPYGELYRVVLARIPGTEVMSVVDKLGKAGFREAMIRVEQ